MNDKRKENGAAPRVVKATLARGHSIKIPLDPPQKGVVGRTPSPDDKPVTALVCVTHGAGSEVELPADEFRRLGYLVDPDAAAPPPLAAGPDRELRWLGTAATRWIFAGEHYFLLNPTSDGGTSLIHGERFSGILAPLIMRGRMLDATKDGFLAMNAALKRRSE